MYGNPLHRPALPPLDATTPYLVMRDGRPWLSSIGLAAMMREPHTALVATVQRLDIDPAFRAEHFRESRTPAGARARGLWISPQGFGLLSLTFSRDAQAYWRPVVQEAFRVVANERDAIKVVKPEPQPLDEPPAGWGLDWFLRFFRGAKVRKDALA